jgi:hypothetical protein
MIFGSCHFICSKFFFFYRESKLARRRQEKYKRIKRYALIGVAGTVGGVLIGMCAFEVVAYTRVQASLVVWRRLLLQRAQVWSWAPVPQPALLLLLALRSLVSCVQLCFYNVCVRV